MDDFCFDVRKSPIWPQKQLAGEKSLQSETGILDLFISKESPASC